MDSEKYLEEFDLVLSRIYNRDLVQDWEMSKMADAEMGDL